MLVLGIDLFVNAGVLARLWDQGRERALLADEALFRRIPIGYLTFAIGVVALAVVLGRTATQGIPASLGVGIGFGAVAATLGVVGLWTAIDMTGSFVAAAALTQTVEYAAAGAVLGAFSRPGGRGHERRLFRRTVVVALGLAVAGIVVQNVIGA